MNLHHAALALMERYACTGVKRSAYLTLETWYSAENMPDKAQDALERGVKARDPFSVLQRVR